MEKKYTLAEIRLYLQRSDSLGDAVYYLKNIDEIINAEEHEEDDTDIDYIDLQE